MVYVYILKSIKIPEKYYIGHSENIVKRLNRHNLGLVRSTKFARPWKVIYRKKFISKADAYKREMKIKSFKGGNAFKKLISIE